VIFEISFALVGGINFGLEKSWRLVEQIIKKYPEATWKRKVNQKKKKGTYIIDTG
jgi:hypothetical protein